MVKLACINLLLIQVIALLATSGYCKAGPWRTESSKLIHSDNYRSAKLRSLSTKAGRILEETDSETPLLEENSSLIAHCKDFFELNTSDLSFTGRDDITAHYSMSVSKIVQPKNDEVTIALSYTFCQTTDA